MSNKIMVLATKVNSERLPSAAAQDIEKLRWVYDGYMLNEMNIVVSLQTLKDIDDLILLLKEHRDCFQIAGKSFTFSVSKK